MKNKTMVIALGVVAAAVLFFVLRPSKPADYAAEIKRYRDGRDAFMKDAPDSPFRSIAAQYTGLKYFPADPAYRVKASLIPIEEKKIVPITSSDGRQNDMLEYAWAAFSINGHAGRLLLLEVTESGPEHGKLFLAFADATSARETYGAGRYLDVKKIPGMTSVVLDFNKAYNPYCAYSDTFSCPFPPKENYLDIAISAGEKSWHDPAN